MRSKIIINFIVALFFIVPCLAIDKPLVDPEYKNVDEDIKKVTKECMSKQKNPLKKLECGNDLRNKFEQEGKIRGTDEYCEVNYSKHNFSQLEELFKKLKKQQKAARSSTDLMWDHKLSGEVTKEDLQTEIQWIESRLARMQRSKTGKDEKSLKYLPGWGKKQ